MRDYSDVSDFDNCEYCNKIECECDNESEYDEPIVKDCNKGFKPILIAIAVLLGLLIIGNYFLPFSYKNQQSNKCIIGECKCKKGEKCKCLPFLCCCKKDDNDCDEIEEF